MFSKNSSSNIKTLRDICGIIKINIWFLSLVLGTELQNPFRCPVFCYMKEMTRGGWSPGLEGRDFQTGCPHTREGGGPGDYSSPTHLLVKSPSNPSVTRSGVLLVWRTQPVPGSGVPQLHSPDSTRTALLCSGPSGPQPTRLFIWLLTSTLHDTVQ